MLFTLYGDYVRHYGSTIWIGSLIALMAELGFTPPAVRAAVSRMTRQGWLAASRSGRSSYYALSARGQERIDEAAQRIFKLHPERWDGRWRILAIAASERDRKRRDELRRELTWMGFAALSRGVYLTPADLFDRTASLAERYGLTGRCEMFTADHDGPTPDARLAARCWDLRAIDAAYAEFVAAWLPRLDRHRALAAGGEAAQGGDTPVLPGGEAPTDATRFVEKTRLVHAFRKFLFIDPGLPQDRGRSPPRPPGGPPGSVPAAPSRSLTRPHESGGRVGLRGLRRRDFAPDRFHTGDMAGPLGDLEVTRPRKEGGSEAAAHPRVVREIARVA